MQAVSRTCLLGHVVRVRAPSAVAVPAAAHGRTDVIRGMEAGAARRPGPSAGTVHVDPN